MDAKFRSLSPDDVAVRLNLGRTVLNMFNSSTPSRVNDTVAIALQLNLREAHVHDLLCEARARNRKAR